jgi:tRNA 5-methylaminomethyl-2-thiouridine biosynthesis bifunctional protein
VPTTVLHGRLLADTGTAGTLRCHAFLYAAAWAARFAGFEATGVLQLPAADSAPPPPAGSADRSTTGAARLAAIAAAWGDTGPWLELVGHAAAAARTGWPVASGGLWFPTGGIVDTPRLCAALLRHPDIEVVAAARALPEAPPADDRPVVLACGMATLAAAPARYLELAPVHGQLDFVATAAPPRAPIVGNGYLAPGGGLLAAGATYEYRPWDPDEATRANLRQLAGHAFEWRHRARGTRTTTSDRVAIAGPLFDVEGRSLAPLYASTGHGSMGNVSSHFAAALIAAQITGDAPPMGPGLAAALSPLRFRERQRRRGFRHGAGA